MTSDPTAEQLAELVAPPNADWTITDGPSDEFWFGDGWIGVGDWVTSDDDKSRSEAAFMVAALNAAPSLARDVSQLRDRVAELTEALRRLVNEVDDAMIQEFIGSEDGAEVMQWALDLQDAADVARTALPEIPS